MRASSAMKLLSACCGGFLMTMPVTPVDALKRFWDFRTQADRGDPIGCVDALNREVRYLQIEVFDYNYAPWFEATWRRTTDKCGTPLTGATVEGFDEWTMEYYAGQPIVPGVYSLTADGAPETTGVYKFIVNPGGRLQADMYVCAPWGDYELIIKTKSTNDGNAMEPIAWEVENGPDQYHTWDTLNTPFLDGYKATNTVYTPGSGTRNEGDPDAAIPGYAPIPPDGVETTYKFPIDGAEGYYSLMYSGPFPPLTGADCPNLMPTGVSYVGCYPGGQTGWTTAAGPVGSDNGKDPAEPYRLYDGYDDNGVAEDGVMTLEKCKGICVDGGYTYMGLESAIKCLCGNTLSGTDEDKCGLIDSVAGDVKIPESKFLCSGDSRVLCGTDDKVSVYEIDPTATDEPSPTPTPSGPYTKLGCAQDFRNARIMEDGGFLDDAGMSAEICYAKCQDESPDFVYFGTQFGKQCWCSETLATSVTFDHDKCSTPCLNNTGETCGGIDALSMYTVKDIEPTPGPTPTPEPTAGPTPEPTPAGPYAGLGCAADVRDARYNSNTKGPLMYPTPACSLDAVAQIMEDGGFLDDAGMSAEICYAKCQDESPDFVYFGTQFGKQCWCSETLATSVTFDHDMCTKSCLNNTGEICGGVDALTMYKVKDVEPNPAPTPEPGPSPQYGKRGCAQDARDARIMEDGQFLDDAGMSAESSCVTSEHRTLGRKTT